MMLLPSAGRRRSKKRCAQLIDVGIVVIIVTVGIVEGLKAARRLWIPQAARRLGIPRSPKQRHCRAAMGRN